MNGGTGDQFKAATRLHPALTAGIEKRVLIWIARHLPRAIKPDHLTALGFISQLLAGVAYAAASRDAHALWIVNLLIFLNWFGDSLDGTLARARNQQRPRYGFYVDHVSDTLGALALMSGLACSRYLHWQIAAGMLIFFYVLSIESYLATYTLGRFHLSHGLFGPTEIRILLAVGNVALIFHPYAQVAGRSLLVFDIGGSIAIAGMGAIAMGAAVRHTRTLYREERA